MNSDEKLDQILLDLELIKNHLKIMPDKFVTVTDIEGKIENYEVYALNELKISQSTTNNQKSAIRGFLNFSNGIINKETVKEYLESNDSTSWKSNQLKALRKFTRDYLKLGNWINEFVFSKEKAKIKESIPSNDELALFCSKLDYPVQMIFLILVTSGLRVGEILQLQIEHLDFDTNMIDVSEVHNGNNKSSWISFMTQQVGGFIENYVEDLTENTLFSISYETVQKNFQKVSEETGIKINPHLLRTVFTEKCTKSGLEEKYIDAFCGRIPQSVIRKHYTDYSPEAMRIHYDKIEANLILPFDDS